MTTKRRIGKYVPAIISFAFVLGGSWMLIPRSDDTADAEARVDVVVMTRGMPKGSSSIDVRNVATVRSLPAEARADNSFDSLDDIPDGALGLVVVVPIAEELFLRGFLLRYVERERFWEVPFGLVTPVAAATCAGYAGLTHPAEAVAAVGWFALVSGIAAATRRPIDCILCHAATNLALGAYVLSSNAWWLL